MKAEAKILQFNQGLQRDLLCALCHQPITRRPYLYNGLALCKDCHWAFEENREPRLPAGIVFYGAVSLVCWLGVLYSIIWLWHLLDTATRMTR